jgi:predicted nucleic acid-binding protein
MTRQMADTSVVVAALLGWHEHHDPARKALEHALTDASLVLATPVLLESYAVLTRLPAGHRLHPEDAFALLKDTFTDVPTVALDSDQVWRLLADLESTGISGGRTYDGHILACARKARAQRLLTFNERDFLAFRDPTIEIIRPT